MPTQTNQFRLKLAPSTAYNFIIDWGDGMVEDFKQTTTANVSAAGITHTYATSGIYDIRIKENVPGGFPTVYFRTTNTPPVTADSVKITDITQWGSPRWSSLNGAFADCTNIKTIATDNGSSTLSGVTNFESAWQNCTSLRSFSLIDTSKGTNFKLAWYNCTSLSSFPLINTSNGTNFSSTWQNCTKLTSFPLIDTSKVTSFNNTWSYCTSLTSFPPLNTSNARDLPATWLNCTSLKTFPYIDTRNVGIGGNNSIDISSTWADCFNLTTFPELILSAAKTFNETWAGCVSLTAFPYIDIRNAIFLGYKPSMYTTYGAWGNCRKLVTFPALSTSKVTSFNRTWMDCVSLTAFPLIDTLSGTDFTSTWQNCISLSASDFPTLNMSKMTVGTNCFNGVKLTTTSYSALLTSLCATNFNNSVIFHGGNSNYNSTVPSVTASRNFLVTPIVSGGRGWTITDGGPDINFIISASNQYWYTNFETGSATKTTGSALTSDIRVIDDNGSVLGTQFYQGTKSYYCNSMTDPNAGLTFVVNPTAFNNTNGFIIDFMVYKVAGDSFPSILFVGLSSRTVDPNAQVYNKNSYLLRWLGTPFGSVIAQTTDGVSNIVANNTSWGTVNKWYKITYYYNNVTKYGTVYVDGVQKQTALQERGWYTLPDGNIMIGLFNLGSNAEPSDNGIEAYIDNLGFYTL